VAGWHVSGVGGFDVKFEISVMMICYFMLPVNDFFAT